MWSAAARIEKTQAQRRSPWLLRVRVEFLRGSPFRTLGSRRSWKGPRRFRPSSRAIAPAPATKGRRWQRIRETSLTEVVKGCRARMFRWLTEGVASKGITRTFVQYDGLSRVAQVLRSVRREYVGLNNLLTHDRII